MTSKQFVPIAPRRAPISTEGVIPWIRSNLFGDLRTSIATLFFGAFLFYAGSNFASWGLFSAYWLPDHEACRADGVGACWGVVAEKYRLIIFGRYPFEEQWRPLVSTLLMVALLVASRTRTFWKPWLVGAWLVVIAAFFML